MNPATARSSAGRGKNKGNCSFFLALLAALLVEEGSRSTSKHRLIFYAPQSYSVLLDPFRSPRHNRPILPSNRQFSSIDRQPIDRNFSIHRLTTRKSFSSSDSLHCSDPASISPTPCKIAVLRAVAGFTPCYHIGRKKLLLHLSGGI